MSGLEIFYVLLAIYIVILIICVLLSSVESEELNPSDWVKLIFWPITVSIFLLGVILWLLIWVPRKLFKGICICFYEIKDFFIDIFYSAIKDENQ